MHKILTGPILLAHEFGHAVYGNLFDVENDASSINIEGTSTVQGYCYFTEKRGKAIPTAYSRLKEISYLGGMFGEMLYSGQFSVYGARSDIDEFITTNKYSQSSLLGELYNWYWLDEDAYSYSKIVQQVETEFTNHEIAERLPWLYDAYCRFNQHIDAEKFNSVVHDSFYGRCKTKPNIPYKTLQAMIRKVIK